jgi:hypothetical protein
MTDQLIELGTLSAELTEDRVIDLPDGRHLRLRTEPDMDTSINDYECWGEISNGQRNAYTGRNERPSHFDGAARKIYLIDGPCWWQPFDGFLALTPEQQREAIYHVQNLASFGFVGVILELLDPEKDAYGNYVVRDYASLWGVEWDPTPEYVQSIADELLGELAI